MQCAILAGGLGTRLRPITERIPKALVEVCGEPFAHYQLSWLAEQGVDEAVYLIGYKGELLREFVGDGSRWGLRVRYVDEGEQLRGTAGALRLAVEQGALRDRFFTLYGDSFLPISLKPVWNALDQQDEALMTVFRNAGRFDRSNVIYSGGRVALYDKRAEGATAAAMDFIDYGLSILRRDAVERRIPAGETADLADLMNALSREGRLGGYEVAERFYEVGSLSGLADFEIYAQARGLARGRERACHQ